MPVGEQFLILMGPPVMGMGFGAYLAAGNPDFLPAGLRLLTQGVGGLVIVLCVLIMQGTPI